MSEALAEVEWIRGLFEELTNPNFRIVEWAARSRNRGLLIAACSSDAEARFAKVLSIGDAKSLYDHLRTETSGGANDRRTAIDIQIIRASMDAQGATARCVDPCGMYADAMTKRNGDVPLLQMLMRTGRICITEESVTLEKHNSNPSSRNSSSKTQFDPVTQAVMGARPELITTCYEYFRVTGSHDSVENYADLFTIGLRNDDIQEFDSKWGRNVIVHDKDCT